MRADIRTILEKQAAWQRSRAGNPWAQKLREAVALRRALTSLKKSPPSLCEASPKAKS